MKTMTYGEAINDPSTRLFQEAERCKRDREAVLAMLAKQGITGEAAWRKILAEGLLRP